MPLLKVLILLDLLQLFGLGEKITEPEVPWEETDIGDGQLVTNEVFLVGEVSVKH